MQAIQVKLLEFLKKSEQFVIPIYQRLYSWREEECKQFLDDILKAGKNDEIKSHFLGSIVYVKDGVYQVSDVASLLVIDGQQRLTTVSLLLEALSRKLNKNEHEELPLTSEKIKQHYLINHLNKDEKKYKLLLTETDKESFISLIDGVDFPKDYSKRIKENYEFFKLELSKFDKKDLTALISGLNKLLIVDISLDRNCDNPQLIFESMNSTGRQLSQIDLIRNFLLMGLEPETQKRFYKTYWRKMEDLFEQENIDEYFNRFMRDYLTIKTGKIVKFNMVYDAFKVFQRKDFSNQNSIEQLLEEILVFAGYYVSIFLNKEENPKLKEAFSFIEEMDVEVSAPFLLQVYNDYKKDQLSLEDFSSIVKLVESYIFRRSICFIPTNSLNKTFAEFYRKYVKKENYLESVQAGFQNLKTYKRFPSNEEFRKHLEEDDNNFSLTKYFLAKMENFERKEKISLKEYTLEHIMPQTLTKVWKDALGENFEDIHENFLNNIGNLTLTGYNSEYSNRSFEEKKTIKGGFNESPLKLNKGLKEVDIWNKESIQKRAKELSEKAVKIWGHPKLSKEVLEIYEPKKEIVDQNIYSLEDHKNLTDNLQLKKLFKILQEQVLSLDQNVVEKINKNYIAYKINGNNFVCIKSSSLSLKLFLNTNKSDLKGEGLNLVEDVSKVGHSGTGASLFVLDSDSDVQIAMDLIHQAFEKQGGKFSKVS